MMRRLYAAILLVSFALLGFEVTLLQVLSLAQWHHFASMIISIALLGFGISGTLISLWRKWLVERFEFAIPVLLLLTAVSMAAAVPLSQVSPIRFDSYLLFVEGRQMTSLLLTYLVLTLPFVLGSTVIGLSFVRHTERVGRLYFFNLTGSGVGAILAVASMWWFDASAATAFFALPAALASIIAAERRARAVQRLAILGALACLGLVMFPSSIQPSQFKDISRAADLPDARIIETRQSPFGLVQVVRSRSARHAPGLSLQFGGVIEPHDLVFVNGDAEGTLRESSVGDTTSILNFTTRALPYLITSSGHDDNPKTIFLGMHAEEAVSQALGHGAVGVTTVVPNSVLTTIARDRTASPLNNASVYIVNQKPRSFVSRERQRYSHIILPDAGRFGGGVGLEETDENFLMTAESLDQIWNLLDDHGTIAVTAWMDYPYRYPLRVAVLFVDLLRRKGLPPNLHLSAIRSWTDVTFSISKPALTGVETARIRTFARQMGFDPLVLPDLHPRERDSFNQLQDRTLFEDVDAIVGGGLDRFIADYEFQMAPPTDDRPYFSRFVRWQSLSSLRDQFGDSTTPFFGLGLFIAALTFLQGLFLSLILIVLPIAAVESVRYQSFKTLLYFASLGLGFMFIEIVLIQKFTLYLGDPVYAVSTVLGIVLVGSGVGASHSSRLVPRPGTVALLTAVVGVLGLSYQLFLSPVLDATISFPYLVRVGIGVALLLPIAYAMGHPFPLGLRALSERSRAQIPWAWGVNGCFSVIGASAAPLVSIEWGFATLLIAGCGCYGVAGVSAIVKSSTRRQTGS